MVEFEVEKVEFKIKKVGFGVLNLFIFGNDHVPVADHFLEKRKNLG